MLIYICKTIDFYKKNDIIIIVKESEAIKMDEKKVKEQQVEEAEIEEICAVNCMTCDVN